MAQRPPVHMKLTPENFDVLITLLAIQAGTEELPRLANNAHDLVEKRLHFSRLRTGPDGKAYVDIFMYEEEAAEMIWQLLFAAAQPDLVVENYHSRLQIG